MAVDGAGALRVLTSARGELWAALADVLLLEIRRAICERPDRVRIATPVLTDVPLYAWATRPFAFALGDRELDVVSIASLVDRYLEADGRVDLLTRAERPGGTESASGRQLERLIGRFPPPRLRSRASVGLDALLVLTPGCALVASTGTLQRSGPAGDVGVFSDEPGMRQEAERAFDALWQGARATDGGDPYDR